MRRAGQRREVKVAAGVSHHLPGLPWTWVGPGGRESKMVAEVTAVEWKVVQRVDAPMGGSNQASWTPGIEAWGRGAVCVSEGAGGPTSDLTVSPSSLYFCHSFQTPTRCQCCARHKDTAADKDTVPPGSSFQLVQGTQNLAVKSTAVP